MLAIYLDRPACEHDSWNAYGGTRSRVGKKTALCKADYNCPAGLVVNTAMFCAQSSFAIENSALELILLNTSSTSTLGVRF